MPEHAKTNARPRAGSMLTELMVSCLLLGMLVVAVAPMALRLARQRLLHREVMVARQELMNQMQRLTPLTAKELASLDDDAVNVSTAHGEQLADANLQFQIAPDENGTAKIQLALEWTNRLGVRVQPQRLTAWSAPSANPRPQSAPKSPTEPDEDAATEEASP